MTGADCVTEVGLTRVRGQGKVRVDRAPLHILILVLKAIGQQHTDHVFYLLLRDKVKLELLEEEYQLSAVNWLDGRREPHH